MIKSRITFFGAAFSCLIITTQLVKAQTIDTIRKAKVGTSVRKALTDTTLKVSALLDSARYDSLMLKMANGDHSGRWPVKKSPRPIAGAVFPFYRVVAYYGKIKS